MNELDAALALLRLRKIDHRTLPGARAELRQHGIALPFPEARTLNAGDVVACMRVTDPLILPDNLVGQCTECREAIQYRPSLFGTPADLCCTICAFRRARGDA